MNYSTLESLLIANEGLFDKYKEKKAAKKAAEEQAQREYYESLRKFKIEYKSIIKPELLKLLNSIVKKYAKYNLPWNIKVMLFDDDYGIDCIGIQIFKDEWCLNEFNSNYNPNAVSAFNECFKLIKSYCVSMNDSNKLHSNFSLSAEIVENNEIDINVN